MMGTMPGLAEATDGAEGAAPKQLVYDDAGLLNEEQADELNAQANELGADRATDILIVTSTNSANADVVKMTEDFYDNHAPGYDQPHGDAVILMMDMKHREMYLAGFGKAESLLDDDRLNNIRAKITPALTNGDYSLAFHQYIETAHRYMGFRPGVNPDNILFRVWFQLAVSLVLAAIIVGLMAFRSGGRVTVNRLTYEDEGTSGVLEKQDQFLHTTVTRQKIERKRSGGGSGGGVSGGGHSHSGSRGSF
jgi:uncharacterized protein